MSRTIIFHILRTRQAIIYSMYESVNSSHAFIALSRFASSSGFAAFRLASLGLVYRAFGFRLRYLNFEQKTINTPTLRAQVLL